MVTAVTRQMPGLFGSTAADSIVVFGSATVARLSHDRTGLALGIAGFGGSSPVRPPAASGAPAPPAHRAPTLLALAVAPATISAASDDRKEQGPVRSLHEILLSRDVTMTTTPETARGPAGGSSHW